MNKFKQDIIDLFSGKRGGHVEQWLYSDTIRKVQSGSQLWQAFLKASKDYYIQHNEIALINKISKTLPKQAVDIDTIIDFGVGDDTAVHQKLLPIIDSFVTVKSYVGIDLSKDFLTSAGNIIKQAYPEISSTLIQADFYADNISTPGNKKLALMLGATITNQDMVEGATFPMKHIVDRLAHLKNIVSNDNHMLIAYDANTHYRTALQAYEHPYLEKVITGIMYDVAKITTGNFLPEQWKREMVWDEKAHVVHQCAVATQDQHFSIDQYAFDIKKGQRFVTVNNFKYPKALFQAMCEEAGYKLSVTTSDPQNRIQLQHLLT